MALLGFMGAETGDLSEAAIRGTVVADNSAGNFNPGGAYSYKTGNNTGGNSSVDTPTGLNQPTIYARCYFKSSWASTTANDRTDIMSFWTPSLAAEPGACRLVWNGTQQVLRLISLGNQYGSDYVVSLGSTWHLLEMEVAISATAGVVTIKLDGTQILTATSLNTGTTNIDFGGFGSDNCTSTTVTGYVWVDDCAWSTTGYIGPGVIKAFKFTTGTPNYNTWTQTPTGISNDWNDTPFNATSHAATTTAAASQTGVVNSAGGVGSGDTINAAKVAWVGKTSSTTTDGADSSLFRTPAGASGIDTVTASTVYTTTDAYHQIILAAVPTAAQILNCEAGIRKGTGTNTHTVEDVWLIVDTTPAATTATTGSVTGHGTLVTTFAATAQQRTTVTGAAALTAHFSATARQFTQAFGDSIIITKFRGLFSQRITITGTSVVSGRAGATVPLHETATGVALITARFQASARQVTAIAGHSVLVATFQATARQLSSITAHGLVTANLRATAQPRTTIVGAAQLIAVFRAIAHQQTTVPGHALVAGYFPTTANQIKGTATGAAVMVAVFRATARQQTTLTPHAIVTASFQATARQSTAITGHGLVAASFTASARWHTTITGTASLTAFLGATARQQTTVTGHALVAGYFSVPGFAAGFTIVGRSQLIANLRAFGRQTGTLAGRGFLVAALQARAAQRTTVTAQGLVVPRLIPMAGLHTAAAGHGQLVANLRAQARFAGAAIGQGLLTTHFRATAVQRFTLTGQALVNGLIELPGAAFIVPAGEAWTMVVASGAASIYQVLLPPATATGNTVVVVRSNAGGNNVSVGFQHAGDTINGVAAADTLTAQWQAGHYTDYQNGNYVKW